MPARKTPLENIIGFFMTATPDAVRTAQEAIKGVIAGRADLQPAKKAGKRGGRKKAGETQTQPGLPTE
jgi:hypothetical protein